VFQLFSAELLELMIIEPPTTPEVHPAAVPVSEQLNTPAAAERPSTRNQVLLSRKRLYSPLKTPTRESRRHSSTAANFLDTQSSGSSLGGSVDTWEQHWQETPRLGVLDEFFDADEELNNTVTSAPQLQTISESVELTSSISEISPVIGVKPLQPNPVSSSAPQYCPTGVTYTPGSPRIFPYSAYAPCSPSARLVLGAGARLVISPPYRAVLYGANSRQVLNSTPGVFNPTLPAITHVVDTAPTNTMTGAPGAGIGDPTPKPPPSASESEIKKYKMALNKAVMVYNSRIATVVCVQALEAFLVERVTLAENLLDSLEEAMLYLNEEAAELYVNRLEGTAKDTQVGLTTFITTAQAELQQRAATAALAAASIGPGIPAAPRNAAALKIKAAIVETDADSILEEMHQLRDTLDELSCIIPQSDADFRKMEDKVKSVKSKVKEASQEAQSLRADAIEVGADEIATKLNTGIKTLRKAMNDLQDQVEDCKYNFGIVGGADASNLR